MTLMVGFGAINTGNNLLYLLLGMMLGLIVVSGVASERVLRRLTVERVATAPPHADTESPVEYRVRNHKRRIPSFSIEVREVETRDTRLRRQAVLAARKRDLGEKLGRRAVKRLIEGVPRCLFHRIAPESDLIKTGRVRFPVRGLYHFEAIELATRFPFGLFEKSRRIERPSEVLVLPKTVRSPQLEAPGARPEGKVSKNRIGQGHEYHGLREYVVGEDWRRIHWKTSARRAQLVVRENERELSRTIDIVVWFVAATEGVSEDNQLAETELERTIEVAASLARHYLARGYALGLHTPTGHIQIGVGGGQLMRILRALALLDLTLNGLATHRPAALSNVPRLVVKPQSCVGIPRYANVEGVVTVNRLGDVQVTTFS